MTNKEAIEILKDLWRWEHPNWLEKDIRKALDKGIEALENQKIGHWIKDGDSYSDLYDYKIRCHCSICGNEKFFIDRKTTSGTPCIKNCDNVDKYCSNCGAKMAESEDKKEGSDKESDFKIVSKNAKVDTCYGLETKNGTPLPKGQGMKLINSEKAIDYAKEKNYIKTSGQEEALREVFALATVEAVPKDVLDKIRAEFEHDNKLRTIETDTAYECGKHANKWIPVSERLPEESLNSVIGWDAYRERCVFVQYIDGYFQITGSDESFDIVAWMPVPEPYEAESDPWEKWLYPNRKENEK